MSVQDTQLELQCPKCAGQCAFAPLAKGLQCQSCGFVRELESDADQEARAETDYNPETPHEEQKLYFGTRAFQCQTCGGEVVFIGPALSERCPYCDGPVVLGEDDAAFATMALVPFEVDSETALLSVRNWIAERRAAPRDLADRLVKARLVGLYAPFWTFDSMEAVKYWANYVPTVSFGDRSKRKRKTSGLLAINFDDLLVPASAHVTPLIRDGILHGFYPSRLRPYRAGYLAGFAAEHHQQTVAEGLKANQPDKHLLIRNRIKQHIVKQHSGWPRVTEIKYRTDTSGIRYRRILLPVWILHYSYAGSAYKVVVSGIDGRTFGERPYSLLKLICFSAVGAAAAMALGLVWGAAVVP